jgi:hypothetical protein
MQVIEEKVARLKELARECREYQAERDWSDAKMCEQIPNLGSTKTYKRILDPNDTLEELNVEKQLGNYQAAVEQIRLMRQSCRIPEPEYADFTNVEETLFAVKEAIEEEESIARLVIVEGATGTGKDTAKRAMAKRWPKMVVEVEADELWRDSLNTPLAAIINALGIRRQQDNGEPFRMPLYPLARQELIIEELRKRKLVMVINEAHHMGPRMLNTVKTLINKTPVVVVMMCIPKLLARMMTSAYEEAIQLTGNRLCARITLPPPPVDEVAKLFERRGVKFDSGATETTCAKTVSTDAKQFGNWRYVCQATRELFKLQNGKPLALAQVSTALTKARAKRCADQRVTA